MKKGIIERLCAAFIIGSLLILSGCGENDAPIETRAAATTESESESVTASPIEVDWESVPGDETESETEEVTETPEVTEPIEPEEPAVTTEEPRVIYEPDDTVSPFFIFLTSPVSLARGKEFNVHKYVSYIDDVDRDVELTVDGNVDTSKVGEYPLKLTIRDDAGNSATSKMTVKVYEPAPSSSGGTTTPYTPEPARSFKNFTETYKKNGASVGIDVSRWQGVVDFNKVAADGCEFVIIRIGGYADGTFEDQYFRSNIKNAKAAGLKVGVYWYSEEDGAAAVHANADYLYSLLGGEKLDFPIFFDWEDFSNFEDYNMSMRDLNEMYLAFRDEAVAHGYTAALYNSKYLLTAVWSDEVKAGGVWLAHYIDQTTYTGEYFLWQQGLGRVAGIDGDVDVDVFYPGRANW